MTRRIVQLAGSGAQWALADDGSIWFWTGTGWIDAGRGELPEPERVPEEDMMMVARAQLRAGGAPDLDAMFRHVPRQTARQFLAAQETKGTDLTAQALTASVPPPPKRKPGRPRKHPLP